MTKSIECTLRAKRLRKGCRVPRHTEARCVYGSSRWSSSHYRPLIADCDLNRAWTPCSALLEEGRDVGNCAGSSSSAADRVIGHERRMESSRGHRLPPSPRHSNEVRPAGATASRSRAVPPVRWRGAKKGLGVKFPELRRFGLIYSTTSRSKGSMRWKTRGRASFFRS